MAILTANSNGQVSGQFVVPAGVVAGTKLVEFNGSGGSRGTANYVGSHVRVQRTMQQVFQRFWVWPVDPLAQTFMVNAPSQLSGVDLWFTAKGDSDVIVQIRTTEAGFPTRIVLAETRLSPANIATNGNPTRALFEGLPTLATGVEYALVVMCDDADAALAVAQLGKWDNSVGKWVTSQPYQVGVLLSSSNASTWTAHQDMDLTFRLLSPNFTETSRTIDLGTEEAIEATDLMVMADVDIPSAGARCEFRLTLLDDGNRQIVLAAYQTVNLASPYTGRIKLEALLSGTSTASPVLYPDVQLAVGNVAETATYVTRQFPANGGTEVLVVFDAITPGSSQVQVEIHDGVTWVAVPFDRGAPVEDEWIERVHVMSGFSGTTARLRLTMTGNAAARPLVRNLRCTLT